MRRSGCPPTRAAALHKAPQRRQHRPSATSPPLPLPAGRPGPHRTPAPGEEHPTGADTKPPQRPPNPTRRATAPKSPRGQTPPSRLSSPTPHPSAAAQPATTGRCHRRRPAGTRGAAIPITVASAVSARPPRVSSGPRCLTMVADGGGFSGAGGLQQWRRQQPCLAGERRAGGRER